MVDLVGDLGGCLIVPGNEGAVRRVSAHAVGACYKVHTTSEKQDIQGLLDPCLVHFYHLETHTHIFTQKLAQRCHKAAFAAQSGCTASPVTPSRYQETDIGKTEQGQRRVTHQQQDHSEEHSESPTK